MSKIKLEINQNTNPKTILFLIILSSLIFIFFFSSYIYSNIKTKDYVKTTAVIKELNYDTNYYHYSDKRTSHYIILNYKYNNKEYNYRQKITFTFNNQEGTIKKIYINPNNPNQVKNIYNINTTILLSIMSLLFDIMCIIIYKKLKTKNLNNS